MRRNPMPTALLTAGFLSIGTAAGAAPRAELTGLGTVGGNLSQSNGINIIGQVAGIATTSGGFEHAFLYGGGLMQDLGTLGGSRSYANGINANGQVVGYSYISGNAIQHAFLYSGGSMLDLGTLGGDLSDAQGVNAYGQVVGGANTKSNASVHAFVYSGGFMKDLGTLGGAHSRAYGINDRGQAVGSATTSGNAETHAFLYSDGAMLDLGTLGGRGSEASAINIGGQVVGYSLTTGNAVQHAFLYSGGAMHDLGTLGGSYGQASGINDSGQVVGSAYTSGAVLHAALWNGGSAYDLNNLIQPGWTRLETAAGINNFAQIAGTGYRNGKKEAFLLTLHPDWQGGNGAWNDASRWNFAGIGSFGLTPGTPHDVLINPAASATVSGPADATIRSLQLAGNAGQVVTLVLDGGSITAGSGISLGANGTVAGNGRLAGNIAIQTGGRIHVSGNEVMTLTGNVANGGRIDVQASDGRAGLDIGGSLNSAPGSQMNLLHADVFVHGGTTNSGRISIAGFSTVSGTIDTMAGGQVNVSGVGGEAIFWDDFRNGGSVTVTAGSTATFFGQVSGGGSFGGSGTKYFAGGYAPGNSAAWVTLDGGVEFSGGALTMELHGTTPGTGHDKASFGGAVTLDGAALAVVLLPGWAITVGQVYDLFDWNGSLTGSFSSITLPGLADDRRWNTDALYTSGAIWVSAVPEPRTSQMLLAGIGLLGMFARRRLVR